MTSTELESKGMVMSLFDLQFRTFITLRFLKMIYVIAVLAIALVALTVFSALARHGTGGVVVALLVVPFVALLHLVLTRVALELVALLFRIAESTARLADGVADSAPPGASRHLLADQSGRGPVGPRQPPPGSVPHGSGVHDQTRYDQGRYDQGRYDQRYAPVPHDGRDGHLP